MGVIVSVNSRVDIVCFRIEVASTTEEETPVVIGSSLKISCEVAKRSLSPSKVSSLLCLARLVFSASSPDFCDSREDPWGSSSSITGASSTDGPATSTEVEHFTSEASGAGPFGMDVSVETRASDALGGEYGTSQGCVEREG